MKINKDFECFLEEIFQEEVTPRNLDELSQIIEDMGDYSFFLGLKHIVEKINSPINNSEKVSEYLSEILKLLK